MCERYPTSSLEADKQVHPKQRHTAKRIWERLQEEGFAGGYTIVKDAVRELRRTSQEVYMPLTHPPGEAQVDFGHALVKMNGVLRKICFFVMALPYSDAFFLRAYERECTETFCVKDRVEPATRIGFKTSHFEELTVCRRDFSKSIGFRFREVRHGKPTQDGCGERDTDACRFGLAAAADRETAARCYALKAKRSK